MAHFAPLTNQPNTVLFINTEASFDDLHMCAIERFLAVKDLMKCLSTVRHASVDETHLGCLAQVAHLLLQEGCDVLDVMEFRGMIRE
jgi:hypothetical protein